MKKKIAALVIVAALVAMGFWLVHERRASDQAQTERSIRVAAARQSVILMDIDSATQNYYLNRLDDYQQGRYGGGTDFLRLTLDEAHGRSLMKGVLDHQASGLEPLTTPMPAGSKTERNAQGRVIAYITPEGKRISPDKVITITQEPWKIGPSSTK